MGLLSAPILSRPPSALDAYANSRLIRYCSGLPRDAKEAALAIQAILSQGADANHQGPGGMTPMMLLAGQYGARDAIEALLPQSDLSLVDAGGATALMWAARAGELDNARLLLPGSDALARDSQGFDALMHAANEGRLAMISLLLPASRVGAVDGEGASALARAKGHEAIVELIDAWTAYQDLRSRVPGVSAKARHPRRM